MRFLIDANMPRSIIALVTNLGHQVEFARDIGWAAAPDQEIAARAQASGAALLTRDLDFADVRRYPPALYSGIIVLRLPQAARDAMLFATLDTARLKLAARQGPDIKEWTWGQLHRIEFQHALDSAPWAAALLDRGPMKLSGDGDVVQATHFVDDSFDPLYGASYREIFDLADWDRSVGINVPGQSGQPSSKWMP